VEMRVLQNVLQIALFGVAGVLLVYALVAVR
jgi:hypothetical protein